MKKLFAGCTMVLVNFVITILIICFMIIEKLELVVKMIIIVYVFGSNLNDILIGYCANFVKTAKIIPLYCYLF